MRFKRKIVALGMTVVMSALVSSCGLDSNTPIIGGMMGLGDDEAFKVDEDICSVNVVKIMYMDMQNQYKADFGGEVKWNQKIGDKPFDRYILDKTQNELSIVYAVSALANSNDVQLTDKEKKNVEKAATEYFEGLSEAEKKYTGATKEDVETIYTKYALAEKMYDQDTDGISQTVSDEEARVIKIQYIYIDTSKTDIKTAKKDLAQVKKQVENGYQDFMVQANKYSDAKVEVTLKKNEARKKFEVAAFDLSEDNISEVITDDDGVYLVKCVKSYLEKETENNKQAIIQSRKINQFNEKYEKYIDDISTDINEDVWEDIKVSSDKKVKTHNLMDVYDKYMKTE